MTKLGEVCKHGGLRRCCEICDLAEEIVKLKTENAKLKEKGLRIYMHLRCFEGGPECRECEKYARRLFGYKKRSEMKGKNDSSRTSEQTGN